MLKNKFQDMCPVPANTVKLRVLNNTSCLEAHAGFFRLLMKEILDPYVLGPFDKKLIS